MEVLCAKECRRNADGISGGPQGLGPLGHHYSGASPRVRPDLLRDRGGGGRREAGQERVELHNSQIADYSDRIRLGRRPKGAPGIFMEGRDAASRIQDSLFHSRRNQSWPLAMSDGKGGFSKMRALAGRPRGSVGDNREYRQASFLLPNVLLHHVLRHEKAPDTKVGARTYLLGEAGGS